MKFYLFHWLLSHLCLSNFQPQLHCSIDQLVSAWILHCFHCYNPSLHSPAGRESSLLILFFKVFLIFLAHSCIHMNFKISLLRSQQKSSDFFKMPLLKRSVDWLVDWKGRVMVTDKRDLPSAGSQPAPDQAEAKNQEAKYLIYHILPPRRIGKKLDQKLWRDSVPFGMPGSQPVSLAHWIHRPRPPLEYDEIAMTV